MDHSHLQSSPTPKPSLVGRSAPASKPCSGHNWIVRGEYRYADFGTITNTDTRSCAPGLCVPSSLVITDTLHLRTQTATFGIAYKFGQ